MGAAVKFQVLPQGVAIIAINNPPNNTLNNAVMAGLQMHFQEAHLMRDVRAIVLTGTHNNFSFGVDLTLFQHIQQRGCENHVKFVPAIPFMTMIEDGPKPVVAALQGCVIGAGLEMTLACHFRIADSSAIFSVPDFQNGIIPGLGGTQRLPRLLGVKKAIEFLWMKRPLSAVEAVKIGLIDEVTAGNDVLEKACRLALDISEGRLPWNKSLQRVDRLEAHGEALHALRQARFQSKKQHPNLLHPLLCMDVMEEGILNGGLAGAILEEKFSHGLVNTPTARSMMHVFFARRSVTKVPDVTRRTLQFGKVKHVAVVGSDFTAATITAAFLLPKIPTLLVASSTEDLEAGVNRVKDILNSLADKKDLSHKQMQSMVSLLSGTTVYEDLTNVDLIVEASEDWTQQQHEILEILAKVSHSNCILASNSSLLDLDTLSTKQHFRDRAIVMHFTSPAYSTELVEVSYNGNTSSQTLTNVFALVKSMRKVPLPVKNSAGLIVDRLCFIYSTGLSILSELGVDSCHAHSLLNSFGMTVDIQSFIFQGHLLNLKPHMNLHGTMSLSKDFKSAHPREEDITEMILFPIVNEAYQILHAGIAKTAEHIDIASILGMGFPSYRGGIMYWARSVGIDFIILQLKKWSNLYGSFFKPSILLDDPAHQVLHQAEGQGSDLMARL